MGSRPYAAAALVAALALVPGLPALAQGSAQVTGTVQQIVAATATSPEELVVAEGQPASTTATFALTAQTAYSLVGPGLGSNAPAVGASDLAVGETVAITPAATMTGSIADAGSVALEAQVALGEVTSVSNTLGQPMAFTLSADGQTLAFTAASDMAVNPSGGALATGQEAVVYSLNEGGNSLTAYVVDLSGAFPTFTGTIASATGSDLVLDTAAGPLSFAYTASTPVTVGSAAADDTFLIPGAQATVTYTLEPSGATATAIALTPSTVSGTIEAVSSVQGSTDLTVTTSSGTVTVVLGPSTNLGGTAPSQFAVGASLTATGVLVGTTLTAVSASLGTSTASDQASGTVTAASATSLTVSTSGGSMTFALTSATAVTVGAYSATVADLAPGEEVTVDYTPNAASGSSTPEDLATAVAITPQHLAGTVGPSPSASSFTLETAAGPVSVTVAPDAAVTGSLAAGAAVNLLGVALSPTRFTAFSVTVQPASPPPGMRQVVVGTLTAVSGQTLSVTGEDGTVTPVTLTSTTQYLLGRLPVGAGALMAGERVRVWVVPDATTPGQEDALAVYLWPRSVVGVVTAVSTGTQGTVLGVRGRMMGRGFPAGRGRGRGERWGGDAAGGRTLTVVVPPSAQVTALGQNGPASGGSANGSATFQVGERIAATGALATQGLVALQVWTLPPSPPDHDGGGPGHGRKGSGGPPPGRGHGPPWQRGEAHGPGHPRHHHPGR